MYRHLIDFVLDILASVLAELLLRALDALQLAPWLNR